MNKWEYHVITITYDSTRKNWTHGGKAQGEEPVVGMKNILDKFGRDGWELVSLVPDDTTLTYVAGEVSGFDVSRYRAVFKRP